MDTSGSKILMADDDRIVRRIVVAKLSGLGYDMTKAEDGQEALRLLEDGFVPDLVITDSLMPRMTGLELTQSIRSSPDADVAKLPIIMLTSRQGEHDVIEGLQTGLDDYVTKPFSPGTLPRKRRRLGYLAQNPTRRGRRGCGRPSWRRRGRCRRP